MKKDICIELLDDQLVTYIRDIKETMQDLQELNSDIFGDPDIYRQAKVFNELEDFEKNILCIYLFCGSYVKMEKYLNIKRSSICGEVNRIKSKMLK